MEYNKSTRKEKNMTEQEIFEKLKEIKKGRYISLRKTKDLGSGVTKVSDLVIRLGVDYSKMKINEGRQTGSLPWGHWVEGYEQLVIEHKGIYYLRVASSYTKHNRSYYYMDGQEITKAEALSVVGAKKMESKNPDIYNIRFDNIIHIGKES